MNIVTPGWVRDAVFYQIFPDRFASSRRVAKPGPLEAWSARPTSHGFKGGDLRGIAEHLDELADLGVTALYLTPIFQSASNHRYHAYDYLRVDPLLGGDDALRELLDASHRRGIRVVLDGVFNHTGRGFWAFHHVLENGARSPYRHWFHFDQHGLDAGRPIAAYPTRDDMAEMWRDERAGEQRNGELSLRHLGYRAWWDLPPLPKLNVANPATREYLLGVAEHWIRFGIDGWRLDVPEEIDDGSFWRDFRARVKGLNPDAYLVGEIWREAPEWVAGDRFDALMNYPLLEAVLGFAAGSRLDPSVVAGQSELAANVRPLDAAAFAARLEHLLDVYDSSVTNVQLNLLDSHDTPRFVTMAGGDRAALRLATIIQMTLPGAPSIYYGDEVGMEGRADPDNRRGYPWDPAAQDHELRAFVRGAVALRRRHAALRAGGSFRTLAATGMAYAYLRLEDGIRGEEPRTDPEGRRRHALGAGSEGGAPVVGREGDAPGARAQGALPGAGRDSGHLPGAGAGFVVAVNAGEEAARLEVSAPELAGRLVVAEAWPGMPAAEPRHPARTDDGLLSIELPGRQARVLRAEP